MRIFSIPLGILSILLLLSPLARAGEVVCEGLYKRHLQGFDDDGAGHMFWSFTVALVKTDLSGHVQRMVHVRSHHGDLTVYGGRVYVAVNHGAFNQPAGKADSWVYVYSADDLSLIRRVRTPELVHGAGGIACDGKRFAIVGGLPKGTEVNYVYEYDLEMRFVKRHVLRSGYTLLGIQTACWVDDQWWFGCYGGALLRADSGFSFLGSSAIEASYGIAVRDEKTVWTGRHHGPKWGGKGVVFAMSDIVSPSNKAGTKKDRAP